MALYLRSIKPDSFQKRLFDPIKLSLVLDSTETIEDDVEFKIIYSGDPETDEHDQVVCEELVGPIPAGKVGFELETVPPDFDKIPLKTLFGVTSLILIAKYRDQQFLRVGYFVNVGYPGESNLAHDEIESGEEIGDDSDEEYSIAESGESNYEIESDDLEDGDPDNEDVEDESAEQDESDKKDDEEENFQCSDLDDKNSQLNDLKEENSDEKGPNVERLDKERKNSQSEESYNFKNGEKPLLKYKNISESSMVGESSFDEINEELKKVVGASPGMENSISEENKFIYEGKIFDKTKIEIELSDPPLMTSFTIKWNDECEEDEENEFD